MLSVYTADRIEAGLVLHFPMNTAPSGGVTESIRFPEIMSNNLHKILNMFMTSYFPCLILKLTMLLSLTLTMYFQAVKLINTQ